jgi:hypothetical protein
MQLADLLNQDPGSGNLNLRAYVASIVGPRRVVHGQRLVKRVPLVGAVQLLRSTGTGKQATFYEVWLPLSSLVALPGGGALFGFSPSDSGGAENNYQITLTFTQRFTGILLNDDNLYAAVLSDALGGPLAAPVSVVVSSVVF